MVTQSCLLEPYRNPINTEQIRTCLGKQIDLHNEFLRKAKREQTPKPDIPFLWLLTPTASADILQQQTRAEASLQEWGPGIYLMIPILNTALVVIHQLPRQPDTLWLRLMGRGRVQQQAVDDLLSLAPDDLMRENTLKTLSNCRIVIDTQQEDLAEEERELIMNLSPVFLEWEQSTLDRGRQEGIAEGRHDGTLSLVQRLITQRFQRVSSTLQQQVAALPTEKLEELAVALLELSTEADLQVWLDRQSSQ